MKRITNTICAVLLSGIFMVMTGVNVNATEQEYPPAEAVFPEEKVLQIENQIKNTPIYNDKDAEGNFSLKNTRATGTFNINKYPSSMSTSHALYFSMLLISPNNKTFTIFSFFSLSRIK